MPAEKNQIEEIAMRCVRICEEKKAADIVLFDKSGDSILADYYLVCCGTSLQHIRALAENLRRALVDEGIRPRGQEGVSNSQWIVLDYGVILVHIMTPDMRRRYCLEDLWDKNLIVWQGGEELPPESSYDDAQWDEEGSYSSDDDFEDDFDDDFEDDDDFGDDDFEDGFDDDFDDDDYDDDYDEEELEVIDVDEFDGDEPERKKDDKEEKDKFTLRDLFNDDDK